MLWWNNLNSNVKIVDTKKKFFDKYLYKAVIYVPMGRLILLDKPSLILGNYLRRQDDEVSYNYAGSWMKSRRYHNRYASLLNIEYFQKVKQENGNDLKFRIEEPYISIYSNDEHKLYDIMSEIPDLTPNKRHSISILNEIHKPASAESREILDRGEIVVKNVTDYNYKVMLRESGKINFEVRQQIYDYLVSLGDVVKMTPGCKRNLIERNHWFTSTYFYTKDPSILTFLNLINTDIVSGIFKLTLATDK